MKAKPDWRHAFEKTRERYERGALEARSRGQALYQFGGGRYFNPTRLSPLKIAELARRAAAATTDRAINQYNEQVR